MIKVNPSSDPLDNSPTVYLGLRIASDAVEQPTPLSHPDGVKVALVPPGHEDVVGIEIEVATRDLALARKFWVEGLGAEELSGGRFRVGDSVVRCSVEPNLVPMEARQGKGFRYLTVQVFNCDQEHERITGLGFASGLAPVTLGGLARICFVRDSDGGWVEVSQRSNLTGALPK